MPTKISPAANLFLLLLTVYVLTTSGNTTDVTDDGMIRYSVTQRLVEDGRFDLPKDIGERWGVRGIDGRYYTNHGVGQSLLNIPFYMLGKLIGRPKFSVSLLGPLVCALIGLVAFKFARRLGFSVRACIVLSLLVGLCTQVWPESKSPFNHSTECLLSLLAVYLIWSATFADLGMAKRHWVLVSCGACVGFGVLTRATMLFWLIPFAVFVGIVALKKRDSSSRFQFFAKTWASFLLGFLPFLFLFFWYNAVRFGAILEAGYGTWAREHHIENFSNPAWLGLAGELLSPGKGAFVYCPVLIIGFLGAKGFFKRFQELAILILTASVFFLLLFASYKAWHGDNAWGPRYLTLLMPLWLLSAGVWLDSRTGPIFNRRTRWVALVVVLSFLIQLAAVTIDKNLHYIRLYHAGVINDANTYDYPLKLYFDPTFSPLFNRFKEVLEALAFTLRKIFFEGNVAGSEAEELLSIDFWWLNRGARGINPWGCIALAAPLFFEIYACAARLLAVSKRETFDQDNACRSNSARSNSEFRSLQ